MKRILAPILGAVFLTGCGTVLPPLQPSGTVWGIPYTLQIVPDTRLAPLLGQATGHRIELTQRAQGSLFAFAHELTHVWQWVHGLPVRWIGQPCLVQPAHHCGQLGLEAQADAVAVAILQAGCTWGDLGLAGLVSNGCVLPDPATVQP